MVPVPSPSVLVVFGLIAAAFILFYREPVPPDITAIGVFTATIVLEPWTGVSLTEGLSGFSNPAVLTILAMFVLSEGVRRTGLLHRATRMLFSVTGNSARRQLAGTVGAVAPVSGIINNTPVVAMLIPVVSDLAERAGRPPSRLLIPLSYAAIAGGLLTLIGSSSNLLASAVSMRLLDRPFSMFEFTKLGVVVCVVTFLYLVTIGDRLLRRAGGEGHAAVPDEVETFLTELIVEEGSEYAGHTVQRFIEDLGIDMDVVAVYRDGERIEQPFFGVRIQKGDVLAVRADEESLVEILQEKDISLISEKGQEYEEIKDKGGFSLVDLIVLPGSSLVGETLISSSFRRLYEASVLAISRQGEVFNRRLNDIRFRPGDGLLVQTTDETLERLTGSTEVAIARGSELMDFRAEKATKAALIMVGVIALAAGGVFDIVVAAFLGLLAMIVTRCIEPRHVYGSIDWQVIFLLAGVIPLGIALENSGAAGYVAELVLLLDGALSPVLIMGVLFIIANVLANLIDANAAVVLMAPIAIRVARQLGADPFSFLLAVTFAVGTAFMTPIGYQTNLMVYGPGHYSFRDFLRVGGPLQAILTVVIIAGIYLFWGV